MRTLLIAALLLSSLPFSAASAQVGDQDRARLHFQAGASYYEAGDYDDALREFQRSYELSQKPELFYNLSLCYQQLGDLQQAVSFLERYLADVADIPNRPNLERRLQNFRARIAASQTGTGEGASDTQDVEDTGTAAPGDADSTTAGDADSTTAGDTDSAARDDSRSTTESDAVGAGRATATPRTNDDDHAVVEDGGANVPAIVGFSIAGAGAVMLGVSGGLAMAKRSELDDDGCRPNCASSDVSSLRRRAALADVGLGLAVAGAAAGVIFLMVGGNDDDANAEARRLRLEPYAGPRGAGASLSGRF